MAQAFTSEGVQHGQGLALALSLPALAGIPDCGEGSRQQGLKRQYQEQGLHQAAVALHAVAHISRCQVIMSLAGLTAGDHSSVTVHGGCNWEHTAGTNEGHSWWLRLPPWAGLAHTGETHAGADLQRGRHHSTCTTGHVPSRCQPLGRSLPGRGGADRHTAHPVQELPADAKPRAGLGHDEAVQAVRQEEAAFTGGTLWSGAALDGWEACLLIQHKRPAAWQDCVPCEHQHQHQYQGCSVKQSTASCSSGRRC